MSIAELRNRYEQELVRIAEKMASLEKRRGVAELVLSELGALTPGRTAKPGRKPGRKPGKKAARRKRRPGGMTARDAVLTMLGSAKGPLTPKEIITGAAEKSNCAGNSLRAQIGTLTKTGEILQVPHKGRGYQYKLK